MGPEALAPIGISFLLVVVAVVLWEFHGEIWGVLSNVLSSRPADSAPEEPVVSAVVDTQQTATIGFAKPNNGHNETIVCCGHVTKLAAETGDDPANVSAAIIALARVILRAKRANGSPKLGETDAIRHGLGITPGSSNPLYALARAALQAEIARQRGEPPPRDKIADVREDGRVIRETPAGDRYVAGDGRQAPA